MRFPETFGKTMPRRRARSSTTKGECYWGGGVDPTAMSISPWLGGNSPYYSSPNNPWDWYLKTHISNKKKPKIWV